VVRGGGFWNDHQNARCAYRNNDDARDVNNDIGFRVVVRTRFGTRTARRDFCYMLPGRGETWRSLFLAAPGSSQAGQIATALHPGRHALVQGF
jgi:hypothetical protein